MLLFRTVRPRVLAFVTSVRFQSKLHQAVENVTVMVEKNDRSSYLLAQYMPEPCRPAFLASRAFLLEINKISDGGLNSESTASKASAHLSSSMGISTADLKFKFWSDLLAKAFTNPHSSVDLGEPIALILRQAVRDNLNLDIAYFHQILQTRRHFLQTRQFASIDAMCSYGEGTYSQLNYVAQSLMLSPAISPSATSLLEHSTELQGLAADIAAHLGQATAVGSMILGLPFYARSRNQVTLPVDIMARHNVSQEEVVRIAQGHIEEKTPQHKEIRDKLKNVVFDTAVAANDHILAARTKLDSIKKLVPQVLSNEAKYDQLVQKQHKNWRRNIPDAVFVPYMAGIPTSLYLNKLEKNDFDVFSPSLQSKEWRLPWRSFLSYYSRKI